MYLRQKEEAATIFKQTRAPEGMKAHQAGEMHQRPDEPKISQRMDPEKFARVQKYVEDIQDTRSLTTKTSDSDYWTQTVESEFAESQSRDSLAIDLKDQAYDGICNPYVLIINNANFHHYELYGQKKALYDRDHVRRFVEEAGFRSVVEHFDLKRRSMLNIIEEARQSVEQDDYDSVICIIMSRGDAGHILGVDGRPIAVDQITSLFRGDMCPKLRNKPKLFFLQVNEFYEGDYRSCDPPPDKDFLIALSSTRVGRYPFYVPVEGEKSRQILGSPFISLLMKILRANSHKEDLMTMLARVNKAMGELYTHTSDEDARMQLRSYQLSSLTKKVYFPNFGKTTPAISE